MENQTVKISAPSVEEAIERGLSMLGVSRSQAQIEVIDEGRRGILGIGTRDAVVRLTKAQAPQVAEPPIEPVPEVVQDEEQEATLPTEEDNEVSAPAEYSLSQEQVADIARQALVELLDKMGIECQVTIRLDRSADDDSAPVVLDVHGDELNVLIGYQGKVLNALQHITRLIVSREVEHWVNLVVDVERYKERRANSLHKLAVRMADRVASSGQPVALEPMPPNERREIHVALRDHAQVTTQSVGRGDSRKVTIIPKR